MTGSTAGTRRGHRGRALSPLRPDSVQSSQRHPAADPLASGCEAKGSQPACRRVGVRRRLHSLGDPARELFQHDSGRAQVPSVHGAEVQTCGRTPQPSTWSPGSRLGPPPSWGDSSSAPINKVVETLRPQSPPQAPHGSADPPHPTVTAPDPLGRQVPPDRIPTKPFLLIRESRVQAAAA